MIQEDQGTPEQAQNSPQIKRNSRTPLRASFGQTLQHKNTRKQGVFMHQNKH